jgi:hypothetical protein
MAVYDATDDDDRNNSADSYRPRFKLGDVVTAPTGSLEHCTLLPFATEGQCAHLLFNERLSQRLKSPAVLCDPFELLLSLILLNLIVAYVDDILKASLA